MILKINTGMIRTNTYLVIGSDNEGFIIDPGGNFERIEKLIFDNNVKCRAILLTHEHFDHCLCAASFQRKGLKIYAHETAVKNFQEGIHKTGTRYFNIKIEDFTVDNILYDGEIFDLCGLSVEVIHTPGHTSGSVCYKIGDVIFSGDTLFKSSIGRTDLPTGNDMQIIESIKNRLFTLKGEYRILPGHESETTLSCEKENNKYIR